MTILLPEDDVATANWGAGWRMPTNEEFQELLDNTTCTWTTQNGVNGRLFTASNGNSLFLPAVGSLWDFSLEAAGSVGGYWTSSLHTNDPKFAWNFGFNSSSACVGVGDYGRYIGLSVRPVRSGSQN